jgi:hypothetical protein
VASDIDEQGKVRATILHQWKKGSRGTRMHSTMRFFGPVPPALPKIWKARDKAEVLTFTAFLPDLYRLLEVGKDPTINWQCSLKVGDGVTRLDSVHSSPQTPADLFLRGVPSVPRGSLPREKPR